MAQSYATPRPGPNFAKYGNVPGYVYDPWTDQYYIDPRAAKKHAQDAGYLAPDPAEKSMVEELLPAVGSAAALYGGKEIGQRLPDLIGSIWDSGGAASAATDAVGGAAASSLPFSYQAGNVLAGAPANGVASAASGGTILADGTVVPASEGLLGLGNFATGALGAVGLGAGAYGMAQAYKNKDPLGGAISGAGAGLGASALASSLALSWVPGIGWMAAGGALLGLGAGLLGKLGDKDEWKKEKKKFEKLSGSGIFIPENLLASMPNKGRSKDELIRKDLPPDYIGRDQQGQWVNNKFAETRNEADLRPEDIVNYAAFAEKDPEWFKKPLDQRLAEADKVLKAGAVREAKGSIEIDWDKI
jgi:hypothetical protein